MKNNLTCDDGSIMSNMGCHDHDANKKMKSAYKLKI